MQEEKEGVIFAVRVQSHLCTVCTASNKWNKGLGSDLSTHVCVYVCVYVCVLCERQELAYCTQSTQEGRRGQLIQ